MGFRWPRSFYVDAHVRYGVTQVYTNQIFIGWFLSAVTPLRDIFFFGMTDTFYKTPYHENGLIVNM